MGSTAIMVLNQGTWISGNTCINELQKLKLALICISVPSSYVEALFMKRDGGIAIRQHCLAGRMRIIAIQGRHGRGVICGVISKNIFLN